MIDRNENIGKTRLVTELEKAKAETAKDLREFTTIEGQPFIEYSLKTKKLLVDQIAQLDQTNL